MKVVCTRPSRVFISPESKEKLDLYIRLCQEEISGLGFARVEGNDFIIEDIMLLPQEVTAGSTDLNNEDVSKFMVSLIKDDIDPSLIKTWWHSHVNGKCFWSSTDNNTIDRFNNDWMVSIVGNHSGEYNVRVDLYKPFRVTLDELDLQIYRPEDLRLEAKIRAEITEKVKKKVHDNFNYGPFRQQVGFFSQRNESCPSKKDVDQELADKELAETWWSKIERQGK